MGVFNNNPPSNDNYEPVPATEHGTKHVLDQTETPKPMPEQGNYDSTIIDSHYHNLRDLISRMDGTTYTTQFYHQLLGATDSPEIFDFNSSTKSSQQLRLIRNLQIKMQGDLSFSKDPEKGTVTITGEANLYPGFTPNKYDTFYGEAGEGRKYLFKVDEVNELSPRRDRSVNIAFSVIKIMEDSDRALLDDCVVESQVFTKEFVSEVGYIDEKKIPTLRELKSFASSGWGMFFDYFYSPAQRTFIFENAEGLRHYDFFLNRFVKAIIPDWSRYADTEISAFNIGLGNENVSFLWDMLLEGNKNRWLFLNKEMELVSPQSVPWNTDRDSIWYAQVDEFAYPIDENNVLLAEKRLNRVDLKQRCHPPLVTPSEDGSEPPEGTLVLTGGDYKEPSADPFYVLSGAFYQGEETYFSNLEHLVNEYLEQRPVDPAKLHAEFTYVFNHEKDEVRYYHLPVLLLLSKTIVDFDRL